MTTTTTTTTARKSPAQGTIGGEAAHRSFLGGAKNPVRNVGLLVIFIGGLFGTVIFGLPAVVVAALAGLVLVLVTQATHRGSLFERITTRRRWKRRVRAHHDVFTPFDTEEWEALQEVPEGRAERQARSVALAQMRPMPDGADSMGWLQSSPLTPGISWHTPLGQVPYLSAAFHVTGQISGLAPNHLLQKQAQRWSRFLEARASAASLVDQVQVTTRSLPADTTMYERWAVDELDPDALKEAAESYAGVLHEAAYSAMAHRHIISLRWPINSAFLASALRYGEGRDGWRTLMTAEVQAIKVALQDAGAGEVRPLSARALTAHLRHVQDPSKPIDQVGDVDPAAFGVASRDEFGAYVVDGRWWQRTAAIRSEHLALGPRSQLWLLPFQRAATADLLVSTSVHMALLPKRDASKAAKLDLTRDRAEEVSARKKGQTVSDQVTMNASAAAVRAADLAAGTPHHGVEWVAYVTVTAASRAQLMEGVRTIADVAATDLGVERLVWMDGYQSAAAGCTWPINRGLATPATSVGTRATQLLAGKSTKEDLS